MFRNEKYEAADEMKQVFGITLYRIRSLVDIPLHCVKAGDLGGWIEGEKNLSTTGAAWVGDNARVYENAEVYGDAWVSDNARVCGDALVYYDAHVCGVTEVD